jgi:uncharacterized YkwD family protein/spore coat assembly protein SafA
MKSVKKFLFSLIVSLPVFFIGSITAFAASQQIYTVISGDSMWMIASRYQVGISEIISANPQITNPSMIYPGQKITIPSLDDVKAIENKVAQLVNQERAKKGLQPLAINWQLARVARYKSADMAAKNYFSHTSPTYGSPFNMMENFGIRFSSAGENIAKGQTTPEQVMNAWMNSPGHRANILNSSYTIIGVGYVVDGNYWTQLFIG